jgi:hypothetical protein
MTSEMTGDRRRLQGERKLAFILHPSSFILKATTGIRHDAVMPYAPSRPFALHKTIQRKELP